MKIKNDALIKTASFAYGRVQVGFNLELDIHCQHFNYVCLSSSFAQLTFKQQLDVE